MHVNMYGGHVYHVSPGEKKKEFRLDSNDCGFICDGINLAAINDTPCFIWVVCNKLTTV